MRHHSLLMMWTVAGLQIIVAQNVPDCEDVGAALGTDNIADPITVPDLPICVDQRNISQCCSTQFILRQQSIAEQDFLQGLRLELNGRFLQFKTTVSTLRTFIEGQFLLGYFNSIGSLDFLGSRNGLSHISNLIIDLRNNINFIPGDENLMMSTSGSQSSTQAFNVRMFLENVLSRIDNATVRAIARHSKNNNVSQCIGQVIKSNIQNQHIINQTAALQQIRRVMATVKNLEELTRNITTDLAGFRPLQQCIDTVVRLNTCGRCAAIRPPFCQNVCVAIASACYSPFNDVLSGELGQLWEVFRRIVNITRDAIADLNANKGLLNRTAIISQVQTKCQVQVKIPSGETIDHVNIPNLPETIWRNAMTLRGGPFNYTARQIEGPGICRLLRTTVNRCWNGTQVSPIDIMRFDNLTVAGQVNNSIMSITQQELVAQIVSLDTPVTNDLNSPAFLQVAPLGLNRQVGSGNQATRLAFASTSLALVLMVSVFVII